MIFAFKFYKLIALKTIQDLVMSIVILRFFIFNFHFDFISLEILFYYFVECFLAIGTSVRRFEGPNGDAIVAEFVIATIDFAQIL